MPAATMRCIPWWPIARWKLSSRSIGPMLRAKGAKPQPANMVSWYLPTRSPQLCHENTSTQFSLTLNISSSASPVVARRSSSSRAALPALAAEISHQEVRHLPAVARLLGHVAHQPPAVVLARRAVEELARLLDRAHLGVALPDDELQQLVLDPRRRDVGRRSPSAARRRSGRSGSPARAGRRTWSVSTTSGSRRDVDLALPRAHHVDPFVERAALGAGAELPVLHDLEMILRVLRLDRVTKRFGEPDRPQRRFARARRGRVRRHHRRLGHRQVHAAQRHRGARAGRTRETSLFEGTDLTALDDDALTLLRRDHFGFVFQAFHVLPQLSVEQNVALAVAAQRNVPAGKGKKRPSPPWAWPAARRARRASCRAASCSAWRSRVRWWASRSWCWPTSRRATSIRRTRARCWTFSGPGEGTRARRRSSPRIPSRGCRLRPALPADRRRPAASA